MNSRDQQKALRAKRLEGERFEALNAECERLMTSELRRLADSQQKRAAPYATPTFLDPPTPEQIERQIQWEHDAIEAGVKRYREELNDQSRTLADTSPGQRIIREIMKEFVPFLADAQGAIKAGLLEPGRASDWMFLLLLLPPEVLALLTIRAVMITATQGDNDRLRQPTVLSCIRTLVPMIEQEVAFREWKGEERAKKREAQQLGKPYRDLYEELRRSVKSINPRTFRRWMTRIGRLWKQGWPDDQQVQLGGALINYMVEWGGGEYFKVDVIWYMGKRHACVTLTEKACALIEDHHARAEIMQPHHRPMLVPPKPVRWEYGKGYVGGYYLIQKPFIRTKRWKHTAALAEEQARREREQEAAPPRPEDTDDHF